MTTALATLGYPGFAWRRRRQGLNPAELLLRALKTADLDARVVEALVWVALTYANLDWEWLVRQAKLDDLQNRLGFLVTLARQLADQRGNAEVSARLARVEQALEYLAVAAGRRLPALDDGGRTDVAPSAPVA